MPDQAAGVVVGSDVGGILREDIAHDLVDRVVTLLTQSIIDGEQNLSDFSFFIICVSLFSVPDCNISL